MKKFEYATISFANGHVQFNGKDYPLELQEDFMLHEAIAPFGEEGWDVVAVFDDGFLVKREKEPELRTLNYEFKNEIFPYPYFSSYLKPGNSIGYDFTNQNSTIYGGVDLANNPELPVSRCQCQVQYNKDAQDNQIGDEKDGNTEEEI